MNCEIKGFLMFLMKYFHIIVVLFSAISCSVITQQKNNLFLRIHSLELRKKIPDVKDVTIGVIAAKSAGFSNFAGPNFTENLKFNLIRKGYNVLPYTKKKQSTEKEDLLSNVPNTSAPVANSSGSPAPFSPQAYFPASTPVRLGKQDFQITEPSEIAEICKQQKTQIYIGGFLYEGRTGPLLNEEVTTGIIISVYDSDGSLLTQLQYIGDLSMEEFENNSEVARLMSERIRSLLK